VIVLSASTRRPSALGRLGGPEERLRLSMRCRPREWTIVGGVTSDSGRNGMRASPDTNTGYETGTRP